MRGARLILLALGWLFLNVGAPAFADDGLRIIQLKHRPASEIAPLVRPLLGPHDALSVTDFRLIVRAPATTVAEVERLVRQLDVARRQLTISVRHEQAREHERSRHAVEGDVALGKHGRARLPPPHGRDTVIIGDPDGIRYRGGTHETRAQSNTTQQLRVQDGANAFIRMGQSVPHLQRVLELAGNRAVISDTVVMQDAATGFDVRPQVRGAHVQLDITPRIAHLADPRRGIVDFRELATTVTVPLGEWVDLGQVFDDRSEIGRAILQRDAVGGSERWRVLLRVD